MSKIKQFSKHLILIKLFKWINKENKNNKTKRATFKVSVVTIFNLKSLATDHFGSFVRNGEPIKYLKSGITMSQQEVHAAYLLCHGKRIIIYSLNF